MRVEDIDREFRELAKSLKEAQQAFNAGNFAQAQPLYERALELVEKSYSEDHADTCTCLQNLADTYYALRKYKEAVPLFRRLLIVREKQHGVAHPEVATVLFKLAKTYEKMAMPRESESIYRRALRVGEQVYGDESTFVATVLESFAGMLRRAQIRLPEAEQMEERVRDIREHSSSNSGRTTSGFMTKLSMSIPPGSPEALDMAMNAKTADKGGDTSRLRSLKSRGNERSLRFEDIEAEKAPFQFTKAHILAIAAASILVLALAGGAVALLLLPKQQQPEQVTGAWDILSKMLKPAPGSDNGGKGEGQSNRARALIFSSPDGSKQVTLIDGHRSLFTRRGIDMTGTYANDSTGLLLTPDNQSITYRYTKVPAGLLDDEGTYLFASDAPEALIIDKMKVFATTCNRYYNQCRMYPSKVEQVMGDQHISYKNPFNGINALPIKKQLLTYDEDSSDMNLNDYGQLETAIRQLGIWMPSQSNPGSIEFYRAAAGPDGDTIYIRGTDRSGNLLRGSRPGTVYMLVCTQGHMHVQY